MKLSIIIPTYNAEKSIWILINRIHNLKLKGVEKEIIVVDDQSNDKTSRITKKLKGIILITHKKNIGKGGAVWTGLQNATGDIFFIQDDDLEYDPNDIPKIINPILKKEAEIVFGSRRMNEKHKYASSIYYFGGMAIDFVISSILGIRLTDTITGSKAFTKKVLQAIKPIESKGFEVESEITAKAIRAGFIPTEVSITYNPRSHKEGKNIKLHHAFPILFSFIKYSFR